MAGQNGVVLHTGTYSQLRMDWSSTPNVSTNQSTFTATIYVQVTTSGWNIGPWSDVSGSYFGTSSGHTFNGAIPNINGRYNMKTFNTTVNHASDGKGSINIVWKWGVNSSWGGVVNPSGSRTLTLDTIARATQPNISPASQGVGGVITINTPRASSSFTHTLKYDFAGASGTIATGVATSYKWTVPKSLADRIPNSTSNGMTITCITYNGSSNIGSKTVGATITIPDTSEFRPTITSHKVSEAATLPSEFAGTYVQTKSKLKIEMSASGAYSSTIKSYEIKANKATYTSATATTDLLSGSGAQSITLKAVDSRNRSVSTSTSVNVAAYADPSPSALIAVRCNADGAENDEGEYAKLTISASVSPVDNKNKKEFSIKYRPVGSAASYATVALPSTSYTLSSHQVIIPNIDVDSAYEIILVVKDSFSEFTRSLELPTAFTLMDFKSGGRGIALGQVATEDGLNVNLDTHFKREVKYHGINLEDLIKRYSSAPNMLINSNFDIWQRHSSGNCTLTLSSKSQYLADRWSVIGGGSTYFAREKNDETGTYLRFASNNEPSNAYYINLNQYIYIGQRQMQGQDVSFSYILNVDKEMDFVVSIKENHLADAKELKRWTFHAMPGDNYISGTAHKLKFASDDNHVCFMAFGHGAFSKDSGAVRIHSVKLEIGNVPTRYIPPSYQENQEACGQAYQVIGTTTVAMSEQISYFEGGVAVIDCVHPTRMYSLGVVKKAHSVEIADLKIHQGGLLADKSKLSFGEYVSDGHYFGIRWTGVSPNLNTTDRRPQYANMVGLRLEAEIYNT